MHNRTVAVCLVAALALAGWRVGWNLAHGHDMFLDSWVLVHLLRVADGAAELLPRGVLTLHYPLSYLPFLPLAWLIGPLATVKLAYPVVATAAALPAYLLVRGGPLPVAGVMAILLLPDLMIKALTGTPQGVALPLFLLALCFALERRRGPFVLTAAAILLTHHLTGLITLILYATVVALPRSREPGFLREEWPCLAFFSLWPLYWTWTFAATQQAYLGPAFLSLAFTVGAPVALLLVFLTPLLHRLVERVGRWAGNLSASTIGWAAGIAAAAGGLLSSSLIRTPGLADAPIANSAIVAIYGVIFVFGLAAALARHHLGLILFPVTLLALGFANTSVGCARFFDGLRVADYAAAAGLVALYAPGPGARWMNRSVLTGVALLVLIAGGLRLHANYERLFAHTEDQIAAARWLAANVDERASVATDAKMSLLVLGEGSRNATFEGTWWLFTDAPLAPYVGALNGEPRFRDRPIRYVLLSDYMFGRGAEVTWFSPAMQAPESLPARLDTMGRRVWESGGVSIWELDGTAIAVDADEKGRADFMSGLTSNLFAFAAGGPCR